MVFRNFARGFGKLTILVVILFVVACAPQGGDSEQRPIIVREESIPMYIKVGERTGINTDTDAIHFGTAIRGKAANLRRDVHLKNTYNTTQDVTLSVSGFLAPWVTVSETHFVLEPGEKKDLKVEISVTPLWDYGRYNGTLVAQFREVS